MRVRLLPGGDLSIPAHGIHLRAGDEAHLPVWVVERHQGRLEVLDAGPGPGAEPRPPVDVSQYHVGGGWYLVPGHEQKVRKAEAELLLGS